MRASRLLCLLLHVLLATATGCTSGSAELVESPPINVEGVYESAAEVGPLGRVTMTLRLRTNSSRVYNAALLSDDVPVDESRGVGTLGNDHIIINFDVLKEGDFYFEGAVERSGEAIDTITGTFLFPGEPEQLPVTFEFTGALPAEPDDE